MEILALGEKIKRRRKELDMTLKDLAGDRITPGQISLVESGRSNPSMDLLEYLAGALQTSVEYLMESEDTQAEKISIYYEQVAESYILSGDNSAGEKYIENALYYVEKYNLEYRKAKILYLRGKTYIAKGELTLAQQYFLSANGIFIKNNNYEEVINTFLNLGKITLKVKSYHSASSYLRQAEKIYIDNNIGDDFLLGEIYYYMANAYFKMEDVAQAIDYSFLAKSKFEQVHNKEEYAKTLLLISEEYNRKGDLSNAIKYSQKTLEVYKELEEMNNISEIENNLGKLFFEFENLEESFKHYEISKDIRIRKKDDKIIETLINICENHIKLKNISKCEEVLKETSIYLKDEDVKGLIKLNILWYRIYIIKENLKDAEYILLDTYKIAKSNNLFKEAAQIAIMMGKFYIDNKREVEAAKYLDEGVNIFREIGILKN
jgi:transcriptional regulator with XRE-family HTH domain